MRFHRPARRIALGLGAAGIALGSGGLAIAATALIQPAGALSVQVPAVAVREQNVNAAGRIRVALPKTSVGVNGSVSVKNLPVNSAGRLQTQNGAGVTAMASGAYTVPASSNPVTVLDVSGSGTFESMNVMAYNQYWPNDYFSVAVFTDGVLAFDRNVGALCCWALSPSVFSEAQPNNFRSMYFNAPDGGFAFHHSLQVEILNVTPNTPSSFSGVYHIWYSTGS